jgi:hypothetical protein
VLGLGAGEHEFHGHRVAAGFRGGEIDGAATAAAELAGEGVVAEMTGGKMPLRRPAARRHSHLQNGVREEFVNRNSIDAVSARPSQIV